MCVWQLERARGSTNPSRPVCPGNQIWPSGRLVRETLGCLALLWVKPRVWAGEMGLQVPLPFCHHLREDQLLPVLPLAGMESSGLWKHSGPCTLWSNVSTCAHVCGCANVCMWGGWQGHMSLNITVTSTARQRPE